MLRVAVDEAARAREIGDDDVGRHGGREVLVETVMGKDEDDVDGESGDSVLQDAEAAGGR